MSYPVNNSHQAADEQRTNRFAQTKAQTISEAREDLRLAIIDAQLKGLDPGRVLSVLADEDDDPRPGKKRRGNSRYRTQVYQHMAVLDFYAEVRELREHVPERWKKPLITLQVPTPEQPERPDSAGQQAPQEAVDSGVSEIDPEAWVEYQRNQHGQQADSTGGLTHEPEPLRLGDLPRWHNRDVTYYENKRVRHRGVEEHLTSHRLFLPQVAATAVYYELNDILNELGLSVAPLLDLDGKEAQFDYSDIIELDE